MSEEQNPRSKERFGILELSGQRDLDPCQVECFLTSPNEAENSTKSDGGNTLLCQICKLSFEGVVSSHRLLDHVRSVHSFDIYENGDKCPACNRVFYTSVAFEIHKKSCKIEFEGSISRSSHTEAIDDKKHEDKSDSKRNTEVFRKAVELESENCPEEFDSIDLTIRKDSSDRKNGSNNALKCYICSKVFRRTREFRSHLISSHRSELNDEDFDDLSYRCKKCAITFPNLILLRGHFFKKHITLIIYRCIVCHVVSRSKKSLRIHYNNFHAQKSKGPHSCDECGKEVSSLRALKTHIKLKHGQVKTKQGFRCRLCQQKFDSKESRKLHYEENHLGESLFMCADCGKGFSSKSGLYGHRQLHKTDQPSACPYCDKIFNRRDSYHEHILIHIGPRHRCPHCPKEFVQRSNLVRHIRIHTGQKPYTCTYCDKRFSDKGACNSHIRVHTKEEQCACPYCGQTFTKKQKLKYHIRKHTGEGLMSCEICSKTFTNAFALKEHRAIHDRQTQTICIECGKAFNSEKYLQRHIALVHQELQDSRNALNCPICGKTFYHQTRLKSHLVTHLGKKHLQCLICEKRYSSAKSVRNHLKQRHDLSPDQPEFNESVRSMIDNNQISLISVQLADDSHSSDATFLLNEDSNPIAARSGEDSGEGTTILGGRKSNEDSGNKWQNRSQRYDQKSITSTLGDQDAVSIEKECKNAFDTELIEPKEENEFLETKSPNLASDSKIPDGKDEKVALNYGNTNGDETLRIKSENILEYDQYYNVDTETAMNLVTANATNKIPHEIKKEILNTLYERTDLVRKSLNQLDDEESSPAQLQSNLSAIIEDRIGANDEPNECKSRNNCRDIVSESKDVVDKKLRLGSESSKDISRRRKQLRTPKKYVSPIETLGGINDKLKNILPKRERVEAIARSLKNATSIKEIFVKETK